MKEEFEYLVRGALCCCDKGSHPRRLNLPKAHGVYINQHPVIHSEDCKPGDNISYYGVCSSSTPPKGAEVITLSGYSQDGSGKSVSNAHGYKCCPEIIGQWKGRHDLATIGDSSEAVTTNSYLVCAYGGIIKPTTSGQEYED